MSIFKKLFRQSKKSNSNKASGEDTHDESPRILTVDTPENQYPPEMLAALLSDFFAGKQLSQEQQEVVERKIEAICEQHEDLLEQYLTGVPFTPAQEEKILEATKSIGQDYTAKNLFERYTEQDESEKATRSEVEGSATVMKMPSRFWRCPHCRTVLQKPSYDAMMHILREGGHISGAATCPKCMNPSLQSDVYTKQ